VRRFLNRTVDECECIDTMWLSTRGATLPSRRAADYDYGPLTVPEGEVFLLGDNRGASTDSHVFGPVRQSSLIGRAFWRVVGDVGPL
jgi:signal peptidase I